MMTAQACWAGDVAGTLDQWRIEPLGARAAGEVEELMLSALSDFAEAAVRLFSADGAVIVLYQNECPGLVVASDASSLAFALAEAALQDGPCLVAVRHRRVLQSEDLTIDPRWPQLAPAAVAHGVRGMLSVPLLIHEGPVAVCNLTSGSPSRWSDCEASGVLAASGVLGHFLQASAEARAATVLAEQLQHALRARIVIEQAKGALMERTGVSAKAAFELLRTTARSSRRRVVDVAAAVLAGRAGAAAPSPPTAAQPASDGSSPTGPSSGSDTPK